MCGSVAVIKPGDLGSPYSDSLGPSALLVSGFLSFSRLPVPVLNALERPFRHTVKHGFDFFRSGNLLSDNNVQQLKKTMR